jgi:hypothetical protein
MMQSPIRPVGKPGPEPSVDLIFVLAGRESRKLYGLQLFRNGRAPRLLLSVGRYEIRQFAQLPLPEPLDLFSLAAPIDPPLRHFFVAFSCAGALAERIPLHRLGTLSEVRGLRAWLGRHKEVRRLLVISHRAHRARVELCCRKLLPCTVQCNFLPVPKEFARPSERGRPGADDSARYFLTELGKLFVYWLVLAWAGFGRQEAR